MRVPYAQSVHGEEEINAVVEVLRGNTALGKKTKAFEEEVAAHFGKKHGVMVNSGSSANLLAMEIMALPPNAEVVTPLLTFSTVVAPIVQKRLKPVFVDVNEGMYIPSFEKIAAAAGKRAKALVIPSLLGNVPNLDALGEFAENESLWLLEDSCDTFGGKFNGKPTGAYSHITTTSFYGSHIINGAGGGGMIMVNDKRLADRLVVLRGWGRQSSLFGEGAESERPENRFDAVVGGVEYDRKFVFSEIGYNFLPLELSAAFALEQLKRLPGFVKARNENFAELFEFFKEFEEFFILPKQTPGAESVWLAFPVTIRDGAPFARKELATHLELADIQTRPIFSGNILKQPGFAEIPHRLATKEFPNTERIMRNGLVFACHQGLSGAQIAYMADRIAKFVKIRKK